MKRLASSIMIVLLCISMFSIFAPKVNAEETVIFQDDFESYAVGSFPYPGGWKLVYNGAGNQYQVITSDYAASGTKSLQMVGRYGWSAVVAKDFSSSSNLIGFEAYLMGTPGSWPGVGFGNEAIQPWGRMYGAVSVNTIDGYIVAGSQNLQPCTANTWYKIRVVMDRNARTFNVWINDQLKGTNIPEPYNPWEIQSLRFDVGWHQVMNYYDNVKVFELNEMPPEGGLVGYWSFDEGSGAIVYDSSGNSNHGTLNNGPVWVDGKQGKALSFDGVDDYVRIERSLSLDVTSQITVEAWVYPRAYVDNTGHVSHIISRCDYSGGHIYVLSTYPDSYKISYSVNPYSGEKSSIADLPLNVWTHLAMTYDGSYIRLYINGELDSSYAQTGSIFTTTNWLAIGCKPTGPWGGAGTYAYFNGIIDEVRIYNRALSQQEIQTDMGGLPPPPQTGSISGVVFYLNSEGDVVKVPDAVVSVDYPSWTAISNAEGEYRLDNIPFGLWVVSCVKPGYGFPQRDEIAIIDYGHPETIVNFCMKADIIEDLKERELQTMDLIGEWLLNAGRALDDAATEYNAEVVYDTLMLGLDALITKEGGTELNRWVAEKYFPIEGVTKNLAQIINTHHFTGETGYYEICFRGSLEEYKSKIKNSYSSEFIASMFKEPKPVDQSIKILVDDAKIFLSKLLDFTSSTCVFIRETIMSYNLDKAQMMQELDIPQKILTIGGTSLVIASCPLSIILLGCAIPGVAQLGEGLLIAAGVVQIIATVIRAYKFGEAYNSLVPLYLRVVEQSRGSLLEISDAMDSICNYIFSKDQDNLQFPTIESELLASPYVRIVNTWTEDIECNTAYIMQLSAPALEGISGFQSSYIYRSEGPSFILSVDGLGEILPLKTDYSDDVINWFVYIQSKIEVPVDVVVSSDLYVIYGQPAKPVGAKKYTINYHETLVPLRSVEITVYSPCDLHVFDHAERHVGYTYHDGRVVCEIPKSFYWIEDEEQHVIIVDASGAYRIELRGTSDGEYHLNVKSIFATVVGSDHWINGTIVDGQTLDYHVYVGSSGVPIVDNTPPTTGIVFGEPSIRVGERVFLTTSTPISLIATDNLDGSGISLMSYRICNATHDSGWLTYTKPFNLSSLTDGTYTIAFNSTDNAGNIETTNTIQVTLFSWTYIFTDSYGRGTTLKINTQYKLFQFTAPNKDFGIKHDIKMVQLKNVITICYEDREMRLIASAVDDRIDFCSAIAWDKQTRKTYLLIDKPNC